MVLPHSNSTVYLDMDKIHSGILHRHLPQKALMLCNRHSYRFADCFAVTGPRLPPSPDAVCKATVLTVFPSCPDPACREPESEHLPSWQALRQSAQRILFSQSSLLMVLLLATTPRLGSTTSFTKSIAEICSPFSVSLHSAAVVTASHAAERQSMAE